VREAAAASILRASFEPGRFNLADMLTKALTVYTMTEGVRQMLSLLRHITIRHIA
jgi:hypothetical protein